MRNLAPIFRRSIPLVSKRSNAHVSNLKRPHGASVSDRTFESYITLTSLVVFTEGSKSANFGPGLSPNYSVSGFLLQQTMVYTVKHE